MIKLICSDVDGTLLNKQREIDPVTRQILSSLREKMEIVLASSRMPKALYHLQKDLSIESAPLICYNGALVLRNGDVFSNDNILYSSAIAEEEVKAVAALARDQDIHASIFYNDTWISLKNDSWTEREITNTKAKPDIIFHNSRDEEMYSYIHKAHKIMLMGEPDKLDIIQNELTLKLKACFCRTKTTYLEITPGSTNKSKALLLLLKSLERFNDIKPENIMAFGDNHNDLELLQTVKYGIAVGNAVQEIKDIAYAVAKSNIEHGVANYLKEFLEA
jgi:Cof subfamily protein (haloacid dehalogenase superfamily)